LYEQTWLSGVIGAYPITAKEFAFVDAVMAFTACDEDKAIGFFTFRNPEDDYFMMPSAGTYGIMDERLETNFDEGLEADLRSLA